MKAAIVGAGYIARQHLRAMQAAGAEIVGICDLSPGIAACTAEQFGVSKWYTNLAAMLDAGLPDIVHVTTPTSSHAALARQAIEAGAHVLVEKPITPDLTTWTQLRDFARTNGRHVTEDHNYRFNSSMQRVLALIESGDFGDVVHAEAFYCLTIHEPTGAFADPNAPHACLNIRGHAIHDLLPHMAYLVALLLGKPVSAATEWLKRDPDTILPHDEFRSLITADRGTANLGFSSHARPDGYWMTIYGTKMMARINFFEGRLNLDRLRGGGPLMYLANGLSESRAVRRAAIRSLMRKLSGGPGLYEGLFELVRQTYDAITSGNEPPVTVEDIETTQLIMDQLTRGLEVQLT
jgi:predicted dehydrogenase